MAGDGRDGGVGRPGWGRTGGWDGWVAGMFGHSEQLGAGDQVGTAAWRGGTVPEMTRRPRPGGPPTAPRGSRTLKRSPSAGLWTASRTPVLALRASAVKPR